MNPAVFVDTSSMTAVVSSISSVVASVFVSVASVGYSEVSVWTVMLSKFISVVVSSV